MFIIQRRRVYIDEVAKHGRVKLGTAHATYAPSHPRRCWLRPITAHTYICQLSNEPGFVCLAQGQFKSCLNSISKEKGA